MSRSNTAPEAGVSSGEAHEMPDTSLNVGFEVSRIHARCTPCKRSKTRLYTACSRVDAVRRRAACAGPSTLNRPDGRKRCKACRATPETSQQGLGRDGRGRGHLSRASDATAEAAERYRALVVNHVLQVLLRLRQLAALERHGCLPAVLEVHPQVRALRLRGRAPCSEVGGGGNGAAGCRRRLVCTLQLIPSAPCMTWWSWPAPARTCPWCPRSCWTAGAPAKRSMRSASARNGAVGLPGFEDSHRTSKPAMHIAGTCAYNQLALAVSS